MHCHWCTPLARYDHVMPVSADMHWLKIHECIKYNIALLTFKAFTTNRLTYLAELVSFHTLVPMLRSCSRYILQVNSLRTEFGSRAMPCGPCQLKHWADTTFSIDAFLWNLKLFLHKQLLHRQSVALSTADGCDSSTCFSTYAALPAVY